MQETHMALAIIKQVLRSGKAEGIQRHFKGFIESSCQRVVYRTKVQRKILQADLSSL